MKRYQQRSENGRKETALVVRSIVTQIQIMLIRETHNFSQNSLILPINTCWTELHCWNDLSMHVYKSLQTPLGK